MISPPIRRLQSCMTSTVVLTITVLAVLTTFTASAQQVDSALPSARAAIPAPAAQARILDSYGKLPLSFEANRGQSDGRVKFLSRTSGYSLFLTEDEAVVTLRGSKPETNEARTAGRARTLRSGGSASRAGGVLRMKLRSANPAVKITGVDELAGTSNYFIGNDPARWRTNVPTFAKVKYEGIYSGIDLVYYGNQRQLEYDFILAPGADPRRIAFDVRGAKRIRRDKQGDLVLKMGESEIRWQRPVAYQEKNGARQEIAAHYSITDTNRVGFELANYDASRPLYIDPLLYSTFLGGSDYLDTGYGIAVDGSGNAYVTGATTSRTFPITSGAYQTSFESQNEDAFVTKISPDGSALVYSTFLGTGTWNWGSGIAVDSSGNAYVVGGTFSPNFPTTPGAFNTTCTVSRFGECVYGNAFVTMLNPTGSALVYSTYLGDCAGQSEHFGIALDSAGNAYITGATQATDFPITPGAFQTVCNGCTLNYQSNAFVSKLNPSGTALVYSTYLGGEGGSSGFGIAPDSAGDAYVTGGAGPSFPTTPGAFQTTCGNGGTCGNVFVTEINPAGSALVYSTYLGGSGGFVSADSGSGIAVDGAGNAYVTGAANSNFPVTPGAFQTVCNCSSPYYYGGAFVTKLNPTGSALVYSTYLSGSGGAFGTGIAIDKWGDAYVTGQAGKKFPTANAVQGYGFGPSNAFVTKLNPAGSALVFSTYLGGGPAGSSDAGFAIATDSSGNAYVSGAAYLNFPITPGAFQTTCSGTTCPFVSKIYVAETTASLSSGLNPSIYGQEVTWTATVTAMGPTMPTGKVNFNWSVFTIGTATLNASGVATLTRSNLSADPYPLTAVYVGDANNAGSASPILNQVITQATSSATITSSPNPSTQGEPITFTANINSPYTSPTGTVTFTAGKTVLGTVELKGRIARFTTSTLAVGSTTVTVTYPANSDIAGSSASVTQAVQQ
jgi:Bacterial Ig-like domain (group 3)/Beta-propeller repeat